MQNWKVVADKARRRFAIDDDLAGCAVHGYSTTESSAWTTHPEDDALDCCVLIYLTCCAFQGEHIGGYDVWFHGAFKEFIVGSITSDDVPSISIDNITGSLTIAGCKFLVEGSRLVQCVW